MDMECDVNLFIQMQWTRMREIKYQSAEKHLSGITYMLTYYIHVDIYEYES